MYFLQSKSRRCVILILSALITFGISGQVRSNMNNRVGAVSRAGGPVTLNLNVLPPYSPFYRDYAGYNGVKTIVTLIYQNMTNGNPLQVFLTGSIRKDDNSIVVQVKDAFHPAIPITLTPNMPQTLTGAQLRTMFGNGSTSDLLLTGITSREIVMNQALPEGSYTICVQVKDYSTGQLINEDCRTVNVVYSEPPQIYSPLNNSSVFATNPQYLLTSWSPVTPFAQGVNYRLRIAKLLPGVSPVDALYHSTQIVAEKSNLPTSNYAIDLASGIKLDTGSMYVMQVTASSPVAYIKNNGQSEPVVFYYNKWSEPQVNSPSVLSFLNPNSQKDTLKANNESNLLINWSWLKQVRNIEKGGMRSVMDDSLSQAQKGIVKYELNIMPAKNITANTGQQPFLFRREITQTKNGVIDSYLSMSAAAADSAGFADGGWYKATLNAYNAHGEVVSSAKSDNFIYRRIKDEIPTYNVPVQAVVKYEFKDFPEIYPACITDVTVEAFTSNAHQSQAAQISQTDSKVAQNSDLPGVLIRGKAYTRVASATATTDSVGRLSLTVPVPQRYFRDDSIYYRVKLDNKYYVDKEFGMKGVSVNTKDSIVSFGQLTAKTYAYSLKLKVSKLFASYTLSSDDKSNLKVGLGSGAATSSYSYDEKKGMTYSVKKEEPVAGIPVILYRKVKNANIPPIEGDIKSGQSKVAKNSIVVVAAGVTAVEGDSTFVRFDRLLSYVYQGDEYYLLALGATNQQLTKNQSVKKADTNIGSNGSSAKKLSVIDLQNSINKFTSTGGSFTQMTGVGFSSALLQDLNQGNMQIDTGYIAEEKPFFLPLPSNTADYYRNVTASYDITSCKPPTSIIKGKLLYTWKSDPNKQLRPLANGKFKVMVEYFADGKPIGPIVKASHSGSSFAMSQTFFVPDGSDTYSQGQQLIDQYATMAVGKTDESGNFQVEVVNINQKGDIGNGQLVDKGWSMNNDEKTTPSGGIEGELKGVMSGQDVVNPEMGGDMGFAGMANSNVGSSQTYGTQGIINGGKAVSFDKSSGSFTVGTSANGTKAPAAAGMGNSMMFAPLEDFSGPHPSAPVYTGATQINMNVKKEGDVTLSRMYRIVPDEEYEQYYYPTSSTFSVQAFQENTLPVEKTTCYVKEFTLKVYTVDENGANLGDNTRVTVFRDLKDKKSNMPLGEGDGKYKYAFLLNPQYAGNDANTAAAKDLNAQTIFKTKFEQVWPDSGVAIGSKGYYVQLPRLLKAQANSGFYYLEACSQVNNGNNTYQATFIVAPEVQDDADNAEDYWTGAKVPLVQEETMKLQPLPSRAFIRLYDQTTDKVITAKQNGKVLICPEGQSILFNSVPKPVDNYGYVEVLSSDNPLNKYLKKSDDTKNFLFWGLADGYKTSGSVTKSFKQKGSQFWQDIHLQPSSRLTGHIISPDDKKTSTGGTQQNKVASGTTLTSTSNLVNGTQSQSTGVKKAVNTNIVLAPQNSTQSSSSYQYSSVGTGQLLLLSSGVPSYIQVGDSGKVWETNSDGTFDFPVAGIPGTKIKIIPKDVAYFDSTFVMSSTDAKKASINLNDFNVYKRKHRLLFNVTRKANAQANNPHPHVHGATIQLGDTVITTDQYGGAKLVFENVSVNNYTFIVRGSSGQGLIPQTVNVVSEETKDFVSVNIEMEQGSEVTGTVKLDGQPIKNAKVYIDVPASSSQYSPALYMGTAQSQTSGSSSGMYSYHSYAGTNSAKPTGSITDDANLVVAYTDASGKYKLQGVPVDNQKIQIHATLDTTFTVNGDEKTADIKNKTAITDLTLKSFKGATINNLYGFPLSVESITPVSENQVKVSGLVHWTKSISNFDLEQANQVLRVDDVLFNLVGQEPNKLGVPKDSVVSLNEIESLKLSFLNTYNVKMVPVATGSSGGPGNMPIPKSMEISKEKGYGKIVGKINITDNSFNYPSTYLNFTKGDLFYLANKERNDIVNNNLSVVTSALTENESLAPQNHDPFTYEQSVSKKVNAYKSQPKPLYNLCDKDGGAIAFKLIEFNALANPAKSFIDNQGKIHLNTSLSCKIPNAQPDTFSLVIEDMVLDGNNVYPAKSDSPINLKLEKWNLQIKDWSFSVTEGGILSTNSLLQTAAVDIPVGKFVLRHDLFLMTDFKFDKLAMAGGKIGLVVDSKATGHLNFDNKTGKDMLPHWSFGLLGGAVNASVAKVQALKDLDQQLELNYIQVLSDNELIFQLKQPDHPAILRANPLAKFTPQSIFNGTNFISIAGGLNVGAPHMGDIPLSVVYSDPNTMTLDSVTTNFEGKGGVHFSAEGKRIDIDNKKIVIKGFVKEEPTPTFNPIPATFFAEANGGSPLYHVDLPKDYVTQLTSTGSSGTDDGYKLKLTKGDMHVVDSDWSTLTFSGLMSSNKPSTQGSIKECATDFEVKGDISANSKELTVSDIDTGFGSMTQTFDFANKRLIGTLKIKSELTLGSIILHKGTIETCFDPQGFYVAGGASAFIPAGLLAGDYNLGFMAGFYPLTDHLWSTTNSYIDQSVVDKCYKAATQKLGGLYFACNREILNKSFDFDFIIASGYVKAVALIGGDFYVNVSNGWKIGGRGYVHAYVSAGLSACTGTSISGELTGDGVVSFQVGGDADHPFKDSYFTATIGLGFQAKLEQSLGFTSISKSISIGCHATAGSSGFSFETGDAGSSLTCP